MTNTKGSIMSEEGIIIQVNVEYVEMSVVLQTTARAHSVRHVSIPKVLSERRISQIKNRMSNGGSIMTRGRSLDHEVDARIGKTSEIDFSLIEIIVTAIIAIVHKFSRRKNNIEVCTHSIINQKNKLAENLSQKAPSFDANFDKTSKAYAATNKDFRQRFPSEKSLSPSPEVIEVNCDFFLEVGRKLFCALRQIKNRKVSGILNGNDMAVKKYKKNIPSKLEQLEDKAHALESSLRTLTRFTSVNGFSTEKKNYISESKNSTYLNAQKSKSQREAYDISKLISDFLGRNDAKFLPSYHLPHIYHVTIDSDASTGECIPGVDTNEKIGLGAFHSSWKEKLRNEHFLNPADLYQYLWQSEESRFGGELLKCSIVMIIQTFLEEYSLKWNSSNHAQNVYSEDLENGSKMGTKKEHDLYPQCFFCQKVFLEMPPVCFESCCMEAKFLAMIKTNLCQSLENSVEGTWVWWSITNCQDYEAMFTSAMLGESSDLSDSGDGSEVVMIHQSSVKKSTLFKMAEELSQQKVLIMVEEGRNFLKCTARKMNFTNAEVAKLLLAVAIGRQKQGLKDGFQANGEIDFDCLTQFQSETSDEDAGECVIGTSIEPLWRKVLAASENVAPKKSIYKSIIDESDTSPIGKSSIKIDDTQDKNDFKFEGFRQDSMQFKKTMNMKEPEAEGPDSKKRKGNKSPTKAKDEENDEKTPKKMKIKEAGREKSKGTSPVDPKRGRTKENKEKPTKHEVQDKSPDAKRTKRPRKGKAEGDDSPIDEATKPKKKMASKNLKGKDEVAGKVSSRSKTSKGSKMNESTFAKQIEKSGAKIFGYVPYSLSDPKYVECDWTTLSRVYHKKDIAVYHTRLRKNRFIWCADTLKEEVYTYQNGSIFAILRCDGTGEVFYPDGRPAIVVSKEGENEDEPSSIWVTGKFDNFGHGIIYDNEGNVRLHFSQYWGVYKGPRYNTVVKWKWSVGRVSDVVKGGKWGLPANSSLPSRKGKDNPGQETIDEENLKRSYIPMPFLAVQINSKIAFRLFTQTDMRLIFNSCLSCIRIDFGTIVDARKVAYYDTVVDHEREGNGCINVELASINDAQLPPPPKMPSTIVSAPSDIQTRIPRSSKYLFLHRGIVPPNIDCIVRGRTSTVGTINARK